MSMVLKRKTWEIYSCFGGLYCRHFITIIGNFLSLLNFFFNLHLNHTKRKVKTVLGNHKSAPNTWTFQFEWHLQSLDSFFLFWYVFLVISGEKKKFIKLQYFFQEKAHKDVIVTVMLFLLLLLFIATQRVRSLTGGKCHIFYISFQLFYFSLFQGMLEIWF